MNKVDEIQSKSNKIALIGTIVLWIVFSVVFIFIKITPARPEYKVITISLNETKTSVSPVKKMENVKKVESTAKQPSKSEPEPVNKQVVKKTEQTSKSETTKTTKSVTTKNTPVKKEQPVLTKSMEQLMAENNNAPRKQVEFDESLFADDFVESTSSPVSKSDSTIVQKSSSSFEGSAGKSASSSKQSQVSSNSSDTDTVAEKSSSATTAALEKIASSTYTDLSATGVKSSASITTGTKNGRVSIQMTDGTARELLSPAKPTITISQKNASLIDSTRKVTISFKVLSGGTVPLTGIEIKPSSILPLEIQNEIKVQISVWRFAAAQNDGQASFEYSIIKE